MRGSQLSIETTYDRVPYPNLSYSQTHPDRLATVATLLGMQPAPVDRCRVLELGCASGGNLIPMAYGLPGSTFVGVDNSARQIAEGQAMQTALGLENVALEHMDILDVGDLDLFDYIIAHGVFSWVPRPVQDKVLEVCARNLAPHGVAYVSYNTYPGWHMLGIIRDMMLYHTRELADPQERASRARALLDFLADSVPAENSAYGSFLNIYAQFLRGEIEGAQHRGDALLLHDELEEVNEPFYFHQFVERAAQHGLRYLGEAQFSKMVGSNMAPQVMEGLGRMSTSVVDLEQYMDFLHNRMFRQTLLCHQDVVPSRTVDVGRLEAMYASSRARPVAPDPDLRSRSVVQYRGADGATLSIDHPASKAAMLCLAETWPRPLPFPGLLSLARSRLGLDGDVFIAPDAAIDAQVLAANLLRAYGYSASLVDLHVHAPCPVLEAGERPVASLVARYQARQGARVTNLRHERVVLDGLECFLLRRLDGSHDRRALVDSLEDGPLADGTLALSQEGDQVRDALQTRRELAAGVEERLQWLARSALLIG
jgi:methyltransferase-like protein/SAM-dependent methyltransferase